MLPTIPEKVHLWPAAFVQLAVAMDPTFKHVMARFSSGLAKAMGERRATGKRNNESMIAEMLLTGASEGLARKDGRPRILILPITLARPAYQTLLSRLLRSWNSR